MKKHAQIVTFCVMGLMSLTFMVYAYIKANDAAKEAACGTLLAQENQTLIEKVELLTAQAELMQQQALNAAAEARMQAALAAEAIKECESFQK